MIQIIKQREHVSIVRYSLSFSIIGNDGSGFSFDCDKEGKVDEGKMMPAAVENYHDCLKGEQWRLEGVMYAIDRNKLDEDGGPSYVPVLCTGRWELRKIRANGIREDRHSYWEPAVGKCHCGEEVCLGGFTNTCDKCDRDYNMSGQELAPRSQWGEETGESLSDILNIDHRSPEELLGDEDPGWDYGAQ